jgi:hypothetical protein
VTTTAYRSRHDSCAGPVTGGGAVTGAGALRSAARRVLVVVALALTGLLAFVLLPAGQNAPAVTGGPVLLPPVPTVHSWHPHGPNRPVNPG